MKLTEVFNEDEEVEEQSTLKKPLTSIEEMKSRQSLDENGKSLASDLTNVASNMIEDKKILGKCQLFC